MENDKTLLLAVSFCKKESSILVNSQEKEHLELESNILVSLSFKLTLSQLIKINKSETFTKLFINKTKA